MSRPIIEVNNISKKYDIVHGSSEYVALRDVLMGMVKNPFSFRKPTQTKEQFWALSDISFDVREGEVIGIIGRNGAGKSTFLKVLSRITFPTKGRIALRGKVASLLEVGTGFHPELTGRENVYLNGAILGMTRREIHKKFDQIVEFSGVENFLDTPVKRYSSGMSVRLAFSIAAHLDPDILIVDEVLAVGDAEFQKKCLGKMEEVTKKEGRTILFVSHNMSAVTALCSRSLLFESGKIIKDGETAEVISHYYNQGVSSPASFDLSRRVKKAGDDVAALMSGKITNTDNEIVASVNLNEAVKVCVRYRIFEKNKYRFAPVLYFMTSDNKCAFISSPEPVSGLDPGDYEAQCIVPPNLLNDGDYFVGLRLASYASSEKIHFYEQGILSFNVKDPTGGDSVRKAHAGTLSGIVRPLLDWNIEKD